MLHVVIASKAHCVFFAHFQKYFVSQASRTKRLIHKADNHEDCSSLARPLSDEELKQKEKFWNEKLDFVYQNSDVRIIKVYISVNKIKKTLHDNTQIFYGFDNSMNK
jgi:hypothetical protein